MFSKEPSTTIPAARSLAMGAALAWALTMAPVPAWAQNGSPFAQYQAALTQGRPDEAERIARTALEAAERRGAAEVASGWADLLGMVYISTERFAEAEPLLRRSLAVAERQFGEQAKTMNVVDHLGQALEGLGRLDEAEALFRRSLDTRTRLFGPASRQVSRSLENLSSLAMKRGQYARAEELVRRSLEINQRNNHAAGIVQDLVNLANVSLVLGRLDEAERLYQRVIEVTEKQSGPNHIDLVMPLNNLASLCKDQGRFFEADYLLRRSANIATRAMGPSSLLVARIEGNLGAIYIDQSRFEEGERLIERALNVYVKHLGPEHPDVSYLLNNLGDVFLNTNHLEQAEQLYRQALANDEKALGPAHRSTALRVHNLGVVAEMRGQIADAEVLLRDALGRREKAVGPDHPDTALTRIMLALVLRKEGKDQQAIETVDRALASLARPGVHHRWVPEAYKIRAQAVWALGRRADALNDLKHALDQNEALRTQASGAARDVATAFEKSASAFELMAAYQAEQGDVPQAFAAIERFRARSLLDEMKLAGSDFTEGLAPELRTKIRTREHDLSGRITRLEKRLATLRPDQAQERDGLDGELAQARADLVALDRDIQGLSQSYRRVLSTGGQVATLADVQKRLLREGDLLLSYVIGMEHALVFAVTRESSRVAPLELSAEQAKSLGVDPGPLTAPRLLSVLAREDGQSVFDRLTNPKAAVPTAELFALWQALIPAAERSALVEGKYQRLVIVPNGPLSRLPFEALVVEPGEAPKYLLDTGPPVAYGPSATVLLNLVEAKTEAAKVAEQPEPVLALGDPAYGEPAAPDPSRGPGEDSARYSLGGGKLPRLLFSNWEAQWVAKGFNDSGIKAVALLGPDATERRVRALAPGRKVLHFACHGLVDQAYGNAFGALALTPGPNGDPADDGYLNLRELYGVDLHGCELTILSACDSNRGDTQIGEGTWALSRGFLVAGARRVVASNWLVDDEAAASLVSVYCTLLAKAEKEGKPVDYAGALREAKRWVRGQEKWKAPYYWGSLVLVGPASTSAEPPGDRKQNASH
ncbi:MAG: CHAT domain-containing protein [Isosphaeraceae bacterium]|nr:CHAT domain-containing protein [Isosphaeraceae bacterium]